jgi:predicted SnoaL-like aldol condensation-catalyzing enzyme
MMKSVKTFLLLMALSAPGFLATTAAAETANSSPTTGADAAMTQSKALSNKDIVLAFYEAGLNKKDFSKASQYLGTTYKQHNPHAEDGVEGFRHFVEKLRATTPTSHSEVVRAFSDGDFVILHVHKTQSAQDRGVAIVDIFRLSEGKIIEHWDVTQEIPERTVSGNPMF